MNETVVHVEVEVNPTEDLEKVKLAVENILEQQSLMLNPEHGDNCS